MTDALVSLAVRLTAPAEIPVRVIVACPAESVSTLHGTPEQPPRVTPPGVHYKAHRLTHRRSHARLPADPR